MLKTLKTFLDQLTAPSSEASPAAATHRIHLATAVLLVEVMRADPAIAVAERQVILAALQSRFQLSPEELDSLIALAMDTAQTAYDYQRFTSELNERFTQPEKIAVVEAMWQVAYADGHLDTHENHVISKVAGLLHVTHGEYIAAKLHAKEASPTLRPPHDRERAHDR